MILFQILMGILDIALICLAVHDFRALYKSTKEDD